MSGKSLMVGTRGLHPTERSHFTYIGQTKNYIIIGSATDIKELPHSSRIIVIINYCE